MNLKQIIFWTCLQHPKLVVKVCLYGAILLRYSIVSIIILDAGFKRVFKKNFKYIVKYGQLFFQSERGLGGCNPCLHHGFGTLWSFKWSFPTTKN